MRKIFVGVIVAVAFAGCGESNDVTPLDGSCSCSTAPAVEVAFDNASSMLGASNVQDAIDELASRPVAEVPVGSRIETLSQSSRTEAGRSPRTCWSVPTKLPT